MCAIPRLTDLEITIMKVLWEHGTSLTIQEITNSLVEKKLSVASVTQAMKHLVTKKAVAVDEHVLVSNVYARTFCTCFSQEEFLVAEFQRLQKSVFGSKKMDAMGIFAAFMNIQGDEDIKLEEAETLQKIINHRKKRSQNEERGK